MSTDTSGKVTAARLRRDAYLYIRQSTLYQVANNTESTARQYDLRGRAVALGWPADRIHVIDIDQGHSGASSADREGFQHLVAEVSLGRAGIILGLECSRLARNNADWHRLLQICAHNDTLILDEDGLYDPTSFNDRLVLGLSDPGQLLRREWPGHVVDDVSLTRRRRGRRRPDHSSPGAAFWGCLRSASSSPWAAASWALVSASSRRSSASLAVKVATTLDAPGLPGSLAGARPAAAGW